MKPDTFPPSPEQTGDDQARGDTNAAHPTISHEFPTPNDQSSPPIPEPSRAPTSGPIQAYNFNPAPPNQTPPSSPMQQFQQQQPPQQYQPATPAPVREQLNASQIILQWLTYAFWGWTLLALSVLTGMVITHFVSGVEVGGGIPYGIAAVLVLLPISFVCDTFYSRNEPQKKVGAEMLVMVIHAVIFAIFGIGALIFAVFMLVQMFTGDAEADFTTSSLLTSLIIAFYYGITFIRTLNPPQLPWTQKFYKIFMLVTVGIFIILGIVGPVFSERSIRDDKLITSGIPGVESAISRYASSNNKLPADLSSLTLTGDSQKIVDKNLVTYKPEGVLSTVSSYDDNRYNYSSRSRVTESRKVYKYQLCVTFKKESSKYGKYDYDSYRNDQYTTYISTYQHAAGETCYKLKTSAY